MKAKKVFAHTLLSPVYVFLFLFVLLAGTAVVNSVSNFGWNGRIKEMCREEGGVTIFEKIPLTRTEYENYSRGRDYINIPIEGSTLNPDFPYFNRNNTFTINESKPRVERREYMILRKSDQQLMSQSIRFSRVAGVSWLGIPFTGGFSCRQVDGVTTSIETSIDSEIFDIIGE